MANFAHVENESIVGVYDLLPKNWRNISNFFALENEDELLKSYGWYKIVKVNPPGFDPTLHKLENPSRWFENDTAYETYELVNLPPPPAPYVEPTFTAEELAEIERQNIDRQWVSVRDERDQKIKDFEWRYMRYERQVRLNITPTDNIADMDTYIQALADITQQSDPFNIIWPNYEL
jgi:hypothetical protein